MLPFYCLLRLFCCVFLLVGITLYPVFAAQAEDDDGDDHSDNDQGRARPADRARELFDRAEVIMEEATGVEAQAAIDGGPDDTARRIVDQEGGPAHAVQAGQEGSPGTQDRDKAPEEDRFITMFGKEAFSLFQVSCF